MTRSIDASPLFPTPTPAPEALTPAASGTSGEAQATPAATGESAQATPAAAASTVPVTTPSAEATSAPQATSAPAAAGTPAAGGGMQTAEYEGVSFAFSSALARPARDDRPGGTCRPNAPMLGGGAPAHIAFNFNGEPVTGDVSPFQAQIRVYPARWL